jgi:hypothetical protein
MEDLVNPPNEIAREYEPNRESSTELVYPSDAGSECGAVDFDQSYSSGEI